MTTPDSVFPSDPSTPPILFDVLPPTTSYTPIPVSQSISLSSSTSSVSTPPLLSPPLPTPRLPVTPTALSHSAVTEVPAQLLVKPHLQIMSSSDSTSSSSANNSPGSAAQKSYKKSRPGTMGRLQRSKHPGNMLLAKVSE